MNETELKLSEIIIQDYWADGEHDGWELTGIEADTNMYHRLAIIHKELGRQGLDMVVNYCTQRFGCPVTTEK